MARFTSRGKQEERGQACKWSAEAWRLLRFAGVGGLNTALDLLLLNSLVWIAPPKDAALLLVYNTLGSINSFVLNKYWTFRQWQAVTGREVGRFLITTVLGMLCNDALLWLSSSLLHPLLPDVQLWANLAKVVALGGSALISYLGMRLWVFVGAKR